MSWGMPATPGLEPPRVDVEPTCDRCGEDAWRDDLCADCWHEAAEDDTDPGEWDGDHASALESVYGPEDCDAGDW